MADRRLVVLRGPAGAGKSSLAEALRQELGYPAAAIDTDLFNWMIVPGESNKRVVYDNLCLLAESYLRYGYDVIVSGLILTHEEQGALAALRAKVGLLGGGYWDFYCHVPLDMAMRRSAERDRDVPAEWIHKWWHDAREDLSAVSWPVHELDMQRPLTVNVHEVTAVLSGTQPS